MGSEVLRARWCPLALLPLLPLFGCGQILGLADPVEPPDPSASDAGDAAEHEASGVADAQGGGDQSAPLVDSGGARDVGPDSGAPEAGGDSSASPACDLTKPFDNAQLLSGTDLNAGANQGTPRLSSNELTLYFWSDRGADGGPSSQTHIYSARRTAKGGMFGPPSEMTTLSSAGLDASPTVTLDGFTIFFESTRLGGANSQLFMATRTDLMAPFTGPTLLANVNAVTVDQVTPYVRPDGQALYFSSSLGGASQDIYRSARQSDGTFAPASAVLALNSTHDEYSPCISEDELDVVWGSDRPDVSNLGDFDILFSHRSSTNDGFGTPQNAGTGVNSSSLDLPGWISADYCTLYFESARRGVRELYVARRPPHP